MATTRRTKLGHEVEIALGEVLTHVRGKEALPCRTVDDRSAEQTATARLCIRPYSQRGAAGCRRKVRKCRQAVIPHTDPLSR